MNSQYVENMLMDLFDDMAWGDGVDAENYAEFNNSTSRTFKDASLLTTDNGIVLSFEDGSEFNIIIVQTARSTNGN